MTKIREVTDFMVIWRTRNRLLDNNL
jgi:hypothetical protein